MRQRLLSPLRGLALVFNHNLPADARSHVLSSLRDSLLASIFSREAASAPSCGRQPAVTKE